MMNPWTLWLLFIFVYVYVARSIATGKNANGATAVHRGPFTLLPVMNPLFNIREMSKECILLERHLNSPQQRCTDCIRKHMLTIEGLAEEAISLDKPGKYRRYLLDIPNEIRRLQDDWVAKRDPCDIAQEIREMRKPWSELSFAIPDRPLHVK